MKKNITFILIRVLVFLCLGYFVTIIPLRQDEFGRSIYLNTQEHISVLLGFLVAAMVWILWAYLSLQWNRAKFIKKADEEIKRIRNNEKWKNFQTILEQVKRKSGNYEDCQSRITIFEKTQRSTENQVTYLETEWRKKPVPLSFLGMELDFWAWEIQKLNMYEEDIDALHEFERQLGLLEAKFRSLDDEFKRKIAEIKCFKGIVLQIIASNVTSLLTQHQEISGSFENATRLDTKEQSIGKMEALLKEVQLVIILGVMLSNHYQNQQEGVSM